MFRLNLLFLLLLFTRSSFANDPELAALDEVLSSVRREKGIGEREKEFLEHIMKVVLEQAPKKQKNIAFFFEQCFAFRGGFDDPDLVKKVRDSDNDPPRTIFFLASSTCLKSFDSLAKKFPKNLGLWDLREEVSLPDGSKYQLRLPVFREHFIIELLMSNLEKFHQQPARYQAKIAQLKTAFGALARDKNIFDELLKYYQIIYQNEFFTAQSKTAFENGKGKYLKWVKNPQQKEKSLWDALAIATEEKSRVDRETTVFKSGEWSLLCNFAKIQSNEIGRILGEVLVTLELKNTQSKEVFQNYGALGRMDKKLFDNFMNRVANIVHEKVYKSSRKIKIDKIIQDLFYHHLLVTIHAPEKELDFKFCLSDLRKNFNQVTLGVKNESIKFRAFVNQIINFSLDDYLLVTENTEMLNSQQPVKDLENNSLNWTYIKHHIENADFKNKIEQLNNEKSLKKEYVSWKKEQRAKSREQQLEQKQKEEALRWADDQLALEGGDKKKKKKRKKKNKTASFKEVGSCVERQTWEEVVEEENLEAMECEIISVVPLEKDNSRQSEGDEGQVVDDTEEEARADEEEDRVFSQIDLNLERKISFKNCLAISKDPNEFILNAIKTLEVRKYTGEVVKGFAALIDLTPPELFEFVVAISSNLHSEEFEEDYQELAKNVLRAGKNIDTCHFVFICDRKMKLLNSDKEKIELSIFDIRNLAGERVRFKGKSHNFGRQLFGSATGTREILWNELLKVSLKTFQELISTYPGIITNNPLESQIIGKDYKGKLGIDQGKSHSFLECYFYAQARNNPERFVQEIMATNATDPIRAAFVTFVEELGEKNPLRQAYENYLENRQQKNPEEKAPKVSTPPAVINPASQVATSGLANITNLFSKLSEARNHRSELREKLKKQQEQKQTRDEQLQAKKVKEQEEEFRKKLGGIQLARAYLANQLKADQQELDRLGQEVRLETKNLLAENQHLKGNKEKLQKRSQNLAEEIQNKQAKGLKLTDLKAKRDENAKVLSSQKEEIEKAEKSDVEASNKLQKITHTLGLQDRILERQKVALQKKEDLIKKLKAELNFYNQALTDAKTPVQDFRAKNYFTKFRARVILGEATPSSEKEMVASINHEQKQEDNAKKLYEKPVSQLRVEREKTKDLEASPKEALKRARRLKSQLTWIHERNDERKIQLELAQQRTQNAFLQSAVEQTEKERDEAFERIELMEQSFKEKFAAMEKDLSSRNEKKILELQREKEEVQAQLTANLSQVEEKHRAAIQQLVDQRNSLKLKNRNLQSASQEQEGCIQNLQKDVKQKEKTIRAQKQQLDEKDALIAQLQEQLAKADSRLDAVRKALN